MQNFFRLVLNSEYGWLGSRALARTSPALRRPLITRLSLARVSIKVKRLDKELYEPCRVNLVALEEIQ